MQANIKIARTALQAVNIFGLPAERNILLTRDTMITRMPSMHRIGHFACPAAFYGGVVYLQRTFMNGFEQDCSVRIKYRIFACLKRTQPTNKIVVAWTALVRAGVVHFEFVQLGS